MITATKIFQFEAAHYLEGHPGACKNMHGHSYRLEITITANPASFGLYASSDMIMDFSELKKIVQENIVDLFDHVLLNELSMYDSRRPTAENMVIDIRDILIEKLPVTILLQRVRLYETATSYVEWIRE